MASPSTKTSPLDPISLLVEDHDKVKAMFEDFEKLEDPEDKQELARQICTELKIHTQIEEEIFYPVARECLSEEDQELLDEAIVEHTSAKELIQKIEAADPEEDLYDAEVKVLGELVEHHIKEEEEEMFPKLKKFQAELEVAGAAMVTRKEELMNSVDLDGALEAAQTEAAVAAKASKGRATRDAHARASEEPSSSSKDKPRA